MSDLISRQDAINALWKALFEYEDKTEKQFQETDDLDIGEWMVHRIFVQNMSDIDRQTILNLPSTEPEIIRCRECKRMQEDKLFGQYWCRGNEVKPDHFCGYAERRADE